MNHLINSIIHPFYLFLPTKLIRSTMHSQHASKSYSSSPLISSSSREKCFPFKNLLNLKLYKQNHDYLKNDTLSIPISSSLIEHQPWLLVVAILLFYLYLPSWLCLISSWPEYAPKFPFLSISSLFWVVFFGQAPRPKVDRTLTLTRTWVWQLLPVLPDILQENME